MRSIKRASKFLAGVVIGLAAMGALAQEMVAYHIDDTATQALKGLPTSDQVVTFDDTPSGPKQFYRLKASGP